MCAHAKRLHLHNKDPEAHIRVWWTVNHQSNSARAKTASLRVFQVLDVGAGHNMEGRERRQNSDSNAITTYSF